MSSVAFLIINVAVLIKIALLLYINYFILLFINR